MIRLNEILDVPAQGGECRKVPLTGQIATKSNVRFGLVPVNRPDLSDYRREPILFIGNSRCAPSQRENLCRCSMAGAAVRRRNRSFMPCAAKSKAGIDQVMDKANLQFMNQSVCFGNFGRIDRQNSGRPYPIILRSIPSFFIMWCQPTAMKICPTIRTAKSHPISP